MKLTVSAEGRVIHAEPDAEWTRGAEPNAARAQALLGFWPEVRDEVLGWKFKPFEKDGQAVLAEIDEYIAFAPAERLPKRHVIPPGLSADSRIAITLQRSSCFGSCPAYTVSIDLAGSADKANITFQGLAFVVAPGVHTDSVPAEEVRSLAKKIIDADFYSMEDEYRWPATDLPTYFLSITIDGQEKHVTDYAGVAVGMPAVIEELEREVDRVAELGGGFKVRMGLVSQLDRELRFHAPRRHAQVRASQA